jgi:hypothetical protein
MTSFRDDQKRKLDANVQFNFCFSLQNGEIGMQYNIEQFNEQIALGNMAREP